MDLVKEEDLVEALVSGGFHRLGLILEEAGEVCPAAVGSWAGKVTGPRADALGIGRNLQPTRPLYPT